MSDGADEEAGRLEPLAALGAAIQTLRTRAGLSRAELAGRCDLDPNSLASFEAGQEEPTWGDLRRIAAGVGTDLEKLLLLAEELENRAS
jgi:transcriptional regulator with XRE-family HTH domain